MKLLDRAKSLPAILKSWWAGPVCQTMEGGIPISWPAEWWQRALRPYSGENGTAYACMALYAQTISTLPMHHKRKLANGGHEDITTSALARLTRRPNGYQTHPDLWLNTIFALLSYGNAYLLAFRNERNEVDSLHLMPSRGTQPYVEPETRSVFYGLGANPLAGQIDYLVPARDVLHIRLYCPRHPLIGVSPIEYATMAIGINDAIAGNQAAFFNNMSRPSGVLTTDQQLTAQQMAELTARWKEKSQGLSAGDVPVLAWGMKWQAMTITSEDAQLIQAYRMSIEDIARIFRVPLPLIGEHSHASTYNNVEQLMQAWLSTGLSFLLEHCEAAIARFFNLPADQFAEFDVERLQRVAFESRINSLTKGVQGGIYSPNEARAKEGLPSVEYGSEPRLQAQVVPLSQIGQTPSAEPAPSAEVDRGMAEYQIRKAMAV